MFRNKSAEKEERRKSQRVISRELKVNNWQTSKTKMKELNYMFVQAKWITNDMIANENIMEYKYNEHKTVKHFDKDKNELFTEITLGAAIHQELCQKVQQDIKNLSKKKNKSKVGKLKFKSEVNCIPLRTGSFRLVNSRNIRIPGFKKITVRGIDNIPENAEFATAKLMKKASGIYIVITCYVEKEKKNISKAIGVDSTTRLRYRSSPTRLSNCLFV